MINPEAQLRGILLIKGRLAISPYEERSTDHGQRITIFVFQSLLSIKNIRLTLPTNFMEPGSMDGTLLDASAS